MMHFQQIVCVDGVVSRQWLTYYIYFISNVYMVNTLYIVYWLRQ